MTMKKERRFNPSLPNSSYIFLIVFLFFGITVEKFWSPGNLSTLLLQASVLLTIAMGMAIVIMSGGVDPQWAELFPCRQWLPGLF